MGNLCQSLHYKRRQLEIARASALLLLVAAMIINSKSLLPTRLDWLVIL